MGDEVKKLREIWRVIFKKGYTVDYIDWSKVPKGYDWVARDPWDEEADNDIVRAYRNKPSMTPHPLGGSWDDGNGWLTYCAHQELGLKSPLPDWRESLRRRPV